MMRYLGGSIAMLSVFAMPAYSTDVVEIEEHWALDVGGPDEAQSAPQVSMVMSPTGSMSGNYFLVTLNYWNEPEFAPGGVQVQLWCGEDCVDTDNAQNISPLHHDGETVRWVQRLAINGDSLSFEVDEGHSASWGAFGGDDSLRVVTSTDLTRLNGYLPSISINESGIGYAGNRVSSLVLERIVWRTSDGQEHEMVAPIDIHAVLDP
jgi:hypothetical protein